MQSKIDVSEEIINYFDEMRSPYAKSIVLVMLGFKVDEKYIPWFIQKYNQLKTMYPHENYYKGAYYALIEMEDRFYFGA